MVPEVGVSHSIQRGAVTNSAPTSGSLTSVAGHSAWLVRMNDITTTFATTSGATNASARREPEGARGASNDRGRDGGLDDRAPVIARGHVQARPCRDQDLDALDGEPDHEAEQAAPAATAEREVVDREPRRAIVLVARQRRVHVGIDVDPVRVPVVHLVVPDRPQVRRHDERREARAAEEHPRAPAAHDRAVQHLVAQEHQAREREPDHHGGCGHHRPRPPAVRDRERA